MHFSGKISFAGLRLFAQFVSSRTSKLIATALLLGASAVPALAQDGLSPKAEGAAQYQALFQSWKKLDAIDSGVISIPSIQPLANFTFTSAFGVRSDPFRGSAAMHAGIDLSASYGTPIYATAAIHPQVFGIRLGTCHQRAQLVPTRQIWCRSALPWLEQIDAGKRIANQSA